MNAWRRRRSSGGNGASTALPAPSSVATPLELGNVVARTTPPAGNLDEAVDILDQGARRAGALLYRHPGTVARVSKIFGADPTDESANMAALVVINAMVFQERLAAGAEIYKSLSAARVYWRVFTPPAARYMGANPERRLLPDLQNG